jgi:cobalt-zinc-cadmium efflux system protein
LSRTQRLGVVLLLNLTLVAGLVTTGAAAHSLAVLAAGGDYLLDAAGVGLALLAIRLSARPGNHGRPAGHPNAPRLAALVNGGWLLVLELLVTGAAADRLITGTPAVDGLPVLVVSAVAALGMAAGALVLLSGGEDGERQSGERERQSGERDRQSGERDGERPSGERDLFVAAVLLDTVADAAAAAGAAVTGGIIAATRGWYWLDPAVALTIAMVVAWHAAALIRKALSQLRAASGPAF